MPTLVVYLPLRLAQTETPAAGASAKWQGRVQPTPDGSGQRPTTSQGGKSTAPSRGGKSSTPRQSSKLASTSGGGTPATSGGPVDPPPGRGGVGDSTWADWYQMTMHRAGGETSGPQGPPYLIGMVQVR